MVAHFLGGMNFLAGRITGETAETATVELDGPGTVRLARPAGFAAKTGTVTVGIRPEKLRIASSSDAHPQAFAGTIANTTYLGQSTQLSVALKGDRQQLTVLTSDPQASELPVGASVRLVGDPADMILIEEDAPSTRQ
jgi:ABC-type Fe3+/spermidine/putrescine transport system ATPase subunit